MDNDDFERVWHFTFGVQRLSVLADAIALWMESRIAPRSKESTNGYVHRAEIAHAFFAAGHGDASAEVAYARIVESIKCLEEQHASFLAGPLAESIPSHLEATQHLLCSYADLIERLDYSGAENDARSLRSEAEKCLALQKK